MRQRLLRRRPTSCPLWPQAAAGVRNRRPSRRCRAGSRPPLHLGCPICPRVGAAQPPPLVGEEIPGRRAAGAPRLAADLPLKAEVAVSARHPLDQPRPRRTDRPFAPRAPTLRLRSGIELPCRRRRKGRPRSFLLRSRQRRTDDRSVGRAHLQAQREGDPRGPRSTIQMPRSSLPNRRMRVSMWSSLLPLLGVVPAVPVPSLQRRDLDTPWRCSLKTMCSSRTTRSAHRQRDPREILLVPSLAPTPVLRSRRRRGGHRQCILRDGRRPLAALRRDRRRQVQVRRTPNLGRRPRHRRRCRHRNNNNLRPPLAQLRKSHDRQ